MLRYSLRHGIQTIGIKWRSTLTSRDIACFGLSSSKPIYERLVLSYVTIPQNPNWLIFRETDLFLIIYKTNRWILFNVSVYTSLRDPHGNHQHTKVSLNMSHFI